MGSKRGQAWGFDLMMAIALFMIGILAFYFYTLNYPTENQEQLSSLTSEANKISDTLFSEGYPQNWDSQTVSRLGILTANKINETKLENLYSISLSDYERTQSLLITRYNYYLYFSEPIFIQGTQIEGIGKKSTNPKNLIKITRFVAYKEKAVTAYIEVWE